MGRRADEILDLRIFDPAESDLSSCQDGGLLAGSNGAKTHDLASFQDAWSLDIWEGFFKPTRAGRPSYARCGPKGLGNLAQAAVAALWRALV